MRIVKLLSDGPSRYDNPNTYYQQGCSPRILRELIKFIEKHKENIEKIDAALYLFNNNKLYETLHKASAKGKAVRIATIPIEGYDPRYPKDIVDVYTGNKTAAGQTKRIAAKYVFEKCRLNKNDNFRVYLFPHIYIRSKYVNPFSRGMMPYSLHIKSIYIKLNDGTNFTVLTSSNLAVRDLCKDEILIIIENGINERKTCETFFENLFASSIPLEEYNEDMNISSYPVKLVEMPQKSKIIFTAPFYDESNCITHQKIREIIGKAKKRIFICAQHISAYNIEFSEKFKAGRGEPGFINERGFLWDVIEKAKNGLDVQLLSQTFIDENGNNHGCRKPANKKSYSQFIQAFIDAGMKGYCANRNIHAKFIVADDYLIFTSFNYTPTQFIYLGHVNIPEFYHVPDHSYDGIHSEVGQMITLEDRKNADLLIEYFVAIKKRSDTFIYKE